MTSTFQSFEAQVLAKIDEGLGRNIDSALAIWHGSLMQVLAGMRTGRVGRVPGSSVTYVMSKVGEAPAIRTGKLRANYDTRNVSPTVGQLGSTLVYALHLERGTRNMRPRPAIQPSFHRARAEIEEALKQRIE